MGKTKNPLSLQTVPRYVSKDAKTQSSASCNEGSGNVEKRKTNPIQLRLVWPQRCASQSTTAVQIVIEYHACYNLAKKSPKTDPTKVCDRLQREDRGHKRHKTEKGQNDSPILGPILESTKAPNVFKKLNEKKGSEPNEGGGKIIPKLVSKWDPRAIRKHTFSGWYGFLDF